MKSFRYKRASTSAEAINSLSAPQSAPLGGGTDLLVLMKEGLAEPDELVDVRHIPGARDITVRPDGSVRLGGAVRIADIAAHPVIREKFAVLADAARMVGTPALRNMGTIGGNLCQRPRCWYFRRGVSCLKNGGTGCAAVSGENQYHAVLGGGPCHAVHPSDPAVALTALDATVELLGANDARRSIPIGEFYAEAASSAHGETVLAHGEIVEAIEIPAGASGGTQRYTKLMQRGTWDFALVSLAAVKRRDGETRFVLGGVAPAPYRVNPSVEQDVASGELDDESADALAERALYDAVPLSKNGYKVTQAAALLKRAMLALSRA